jgi:hypothetical protein
MKASPMLSCDREPPPPADGLRATAVRLVPVFFSLVPRLFELAFAIVFSRSAWLLDAQLTRA